MPCTQSRRHDPFYFVSGSVSPYFEADLTGEISVMRTFQEGKSVLYFDGWGGDLFRVSSIIFRHPRKAHCFSASVRLRYLGLKCLSLEVFSSTISTKHFRPEFLILFRRANEPPKKGTNTLLLDSVLASVWENNFQKASHEAKPPCPILSSKSATLFDIAVPELNYFFQICFDIEDKRTF